MLGDGAVEKFEPIVAAGMSLLLGYWRHCHCKGNALFAPDFSVCYVVSYNRRATAQKRHKMPANGRMPLQ
jgi:hypothetical protein